MVEYILGNYLVETGKLTEEQLETVVAKQDETRVKLGLLAVSEGIMTIEQAEKVNQLQSTMDKRFGDIAVEQGYLTDEQIGNLLKKQGNAYLSFAQALVDAGYLNMQELDEMLDGFQKANSFSKSDMEDLKSDEPERIVALYIPNDAMAYKDVIGVLIRTLIRCVDRHAYMGKAIVQDGITVEKGAFQRIADFTSPIEGVTELETGFVEESGALHDIASAFCKMEDLDDEDLLDAAGEFLNCVNGLYASGISREGIDSELMPPVIFNSEKTYTEKGICKIPVCLKNKKSFFVVIGRN